MNRIGEVPVPTEHKFSHSPFSVTSEGQETEGHVYPSDGGIVGSGLVAHIFLSPLS